MNRFRIGHGYDLHKLVAGRNLIIGGVHIPHDKGALGHSDADTLIHAICDALLGAAALGDIGRHFPDDDPSYKNIDSMTLLEKVALLLNDNGFAVGNIDATIILQKPRISSYTEEMRKNIADVLDISMSDVSVKATTTEGLGIIGKEEAIAAEAVALIYY